MNISCCLDTCPSTIPDVPNSSNTRTGTNTVGDTIDYSCDSGYTMVDDTLARVTCEAGGTWSNAPTFQEGNIRITV